VLLDVRWAARRAARHRQLPAGPSSRRGLRRPGPGTWPARPVPAGPAPRCPTRPPSRRRCVAAGVSRDRPVVVLRRQRRDELRPVAGGRCATSAHPDVRVLGRRLPGPGPGAGLPGQHGRARPRRPGGLQRGARPDAGAGLRAGAQETGADRPAPRRAGRGSAYRGETEPVDPVRRAYPRCGERRRRRANVKPGRHLQGPRRGSPPGFAAPPALTLARVRRSVSYLRLRRHRGPTRSSRSRLAGIPAALLRRLLVQLGHRSRPGRWRPAGPVATGG